MSCLKHFAVRGIVIIIADKSAHFQVRDIFGKHSFAVSRAGKSEIKIIQIVFLRNHSLICQAGTRCPRTVSYRRSVIYNRLFVDIRFAGQQNRVVIKTELKIRKSRGIRKIQSIAFYTFTIRYGVCSFKFTVAYKILNISESNGKYFVVIGNMI